MRKFKLLNALSVGLTAIAPMTLLTSCNNKSTTNDIESLVPILKNDTIEYFKQIVRIPRPTNHLTKIRTFLTNLIEAKGYLVQRDTYGSIWFDVPASDTKYKNYPKLMLQGHMDMVFAFDQTKFPEGDPDPVEYEIEPDETIDDQGRTIIQTKDNKTSLGADNGIGVAMALAIALSDDIKHGPLRILITADEESGIRGASQLDPVALGSDYLINLDCGPKYVVTVSAKGASQGEYTQTFDMTPITELGNKYIYTIDISGLAGGHSGVDIVDGRSSAVFEANKILTDSRINTTENNIQLVSWTNPGITAPTSIVYSNSLSFMSDKDITTTLNTLCSERQTWIRENAAADKNAVVAVSKWSALPSGHNYSYISNADTKKVTQLVSDLGYGVVVKGSSQNVGPFTWTQDFSKKKATVILKTYSRSDSDDMIDKFTSDNKTKSEALEFTFNNLTKYYPWHKKDDNKMEKLLTAGVKSLGQEAVIEDCNGGLEPTWFMKKRPTMNIAAIGAAIKDCHKYTETLYVDEVTQSLQLLLYSIDHINEYK